VVTNKKYCDNCGSFNYKLKQRRQRLYKKENKLCENCGEPLNGCKYRCIKCKFTHQAQGWKINGIKGASKELYNELMIKQSGLCALCAKPSKDNKCLFLDHDHITGIPRGLLCDVCNVKLGQFEALYISIEKREQVLQYLQLGKIPLDNHP
jgi:hypothetical protein